MELYLILIIGTFFVFAAFVFGQLIGKWQKNKEWQKTILPKRLKQSRAVVGGQMSEQLAPFLPNFPFDPTECVFVGKPIDFLVFVGSKKKEISEVIFVEVKSNKSSLSSQERHLKTAIEAGKVSWQEYRINYEN